MKKGRKSKNQANKVTFSFFYLIIVPIIQRNDVLASTVQESSSTTCFGILSVVISYRLAFVSS